MRDQIMDKSFIFICLLLLTIIPVTLQEVQKKPIKKHEPCKRIVLYYHDIIFRGNDPVNATSYAATNASGIGSFDFGKVVVFDDPMTRDQHLTSPPVARAQGMYFYNVKYAPNAWFAYSVVFNSSEYEGTLNIVGDDIITEKTRDLSVVGGTGDFFMTRGIVTFETENVEGTKYFRLKMDIKLYECY
ncbi:hypothetical protein CDL15_Pgr018004 [Punica granatum]|nr:hypothetical protein CDL15_Pgr018004 [Punica granatum]